MRNNTKTKLAVAPAKPAPAEAQSKPDPMEIPRYGSLSPEQEAWVRAELLARLQRQFAEMSTCEIRDIAWYADMEQSNRGAHTPAEDFIDSLIMTHRLRGLTPDDVADDLEEFRRTFESIVTCTRNFNARYPKLVA